MDSLNFIKSIKYEDFINAIEGHFDENMALFNLLKSFRTAVQTINGYPTQSSISFNVSFYSHQYINRLLDKLNEMQTLDIYDNLYSITAYEDAYNTASIIIKMDKIQ